MDSNHSRYDFDEPYPPFMSTSITPMDGCYLPIWDPRPLASPVSFFYDERREFLPMEIPAVLQLQVDRSIRSPLIPFIPSLYTPVAAPYPWRGGRHWVPPQDPPYMSQQPMQGSMPDSGFKCSDLMHGRRRHHPQSHSFSDAPVYDSSQSFTESSIFRSPCNHNGQHNSPSSSSPSILLPPATSLNSRYIVDSFGNVFSVDDASHAPLNPSRVIMNGRNVKHQANSIPTCTPESYSRPSWIPRPEDPYFLVPPRDRITGLYDLNLRAPGAKIVIDGVDYTDRLGGTSSGDKMGENSRATPHHHHGRPRNVLDTRDALYLLGPGPRVIRHGRIVRDSDGRPVIFPDINPKQDSYSHFHDRHSHDRYLDLLNESNVKRLVCRPTPLHAPYTFGPSIFADPFHEIAVDQKGMVVIREKEGALLADRRYPNCLCGKRMNDEEIEGGWRLCLHCHEKVRDARELVDVEGRPCLREWLEGGGQGLKPWTGTPGDERYGRYDTHNNHGHHNSSHNASRAGPFKPDPFKERM